MRVTVALHKTESRNPDQMNQQQTVAGRCRPGFSVPNLDQFHSRMVEADVPCMQEPEDVYGARVAQYLDPDGLVISVGEERNGHE